MSFSSAPQAGDCQAFAADVATQGLLARLVAVLAREWQIHRDLRVLQTLDDRALRDIGIGPGGLEHAVRHGRPMPGGIARETAIKSPLPPLPVGWTQWR